MKITIVIPTWNREDLLGRCLSTLNFVEHDKIVVVRNERPTANARNIGVAQCADDDIVFSIDDDCYFTEEINLSQTLSLASGNWGCIQTTRIMRGMKRTEKRELKPVKLCWIGAGLLFKKSTWDFVGGYPKDYLDDVMFSANVYKSGFNNYRSTFSYGYHDVDTRSGGMFEVLKSFGASAFYPCVPGKYFVTGEPCISKGGIENIKNIKPLLELTKLHNENRRKM
jgi:glycosyltransferase involved in cell wall biosynthesis